MTTEPATRRPPRLPALTLSAREWRLWLTTLLASAYLFVWLALSPGSETSATVASAAPPPPMAPETRVVWLADVAPAERPGFVVPVGWTTDTAAPSVTRAETTRRAPPAVRQRHARRVRTRSS